MGTQQGDDMIYIVLAIDSGYAMPAAVTLRSVAENVQGPVTLYVFDCGLHAQDKEKIESSLPLRHDITLNFKDMPPNAVSSRFGAAWAKIDMMKCLSVARAIYLDADVLVRKDLRELWNTDLQGHPLAAVPEVGRPGRHPANRRDGHFNSGVLLMDLTKTRAAFPELETRCLDLKGAGSHDPEDPLNALFKDKWVSLSLTWNAQGLGTYAKWVDVYKGSKEMCLAEMNDPAIVHFTGPVHPSMGAVLDFFQQSVAAKPWGYMGAPGHPYEKDWWDVLDKTAWRGWRETVEYKVMREQARARVLKTAKEDTDKRVPGFSKLVNV